MNSMLKQALQYVKNTNGGASLENFLEDHEPIGKMLWADLGDLVYEEATGQIRLTEKGEAALQEEYCTYPDCNCPADAPADPNWCLRGLKRKSK